MGTSIPPLVVYQANLDFTKQVLDACQQSGDDWLQLTQRVLNGAVAEPPIEADELARSPDAPTFAAVAAKGVCEQWEKGCADMQTVVEMAVANQTTFAANVGRALGDWQRSVSSAFGMPVMANAMFPVDAAGAQPARRAAHKAARKAV